MKHTFFCFVFAFETGFLSVIKIKQRYPLRWFSDYSNMCITKKTNGCKLYPRVAIPPPPVENYSRWRSAGPYFQPRWRPRHEAATWHGATTTDRRENKISRLSSYYRIIIAYIYLYYCMHHC